MAMAMRMAKKQQVQIGKTSTLHLHHVFLHISLPSLHNYDVNLPNFMFYEQREHMTTIFFFFLWTQTVL